MKPVSRSARSCMLAVIGWGAMRALTCAAEPVSFKSDVASILVDNCIACHGPKKAEGGYRLDTFEQLRQPGDSGAEPIMAGAAPGGEILRRVTTSDPDERMPPDANPLPVAAIEAIRGWVASGAAFDGSKPSESLAMVMPPRTHAAAPKAYAHVLPVAALAFTPDGRQLVVGGYHELLVFDAGEGKLLKRIGNLGQRILAITFLADGRTLAVASGEPGRDGDVRLVDFEKGVVTNVFARAGDVVLDLAPRPQSDQVAVASADGIVRIIDTASGAEVRAIASHADWVNAVSWSDDGTKLASASRDRSVKVYDASSGDLLANYQDHGEPVRGIAFAADGKQVLSVGADKKLHRWDIETMKKVAGVDLQGEGYKLVRTADTVSVASTDRLLRSIDLTKNAVSLTFKGHADWPVAIAVHPASGRIASGALDGEVRVWNSGDGSLVKSWIARP